MTTPAIAYNFNGGKATGVHRESFDAHKSSTFSGFASRERVILNRPVKTLFHLLLPCANPGRVVLLDGSHTGVPE